MSSRIVTYIIKRYCTFKFSLSAVNNYMNLFQIKHTFKKC